MSHRIINGQKVGFRIHAFLPTALKKVSGKLISKYQDVGITKHSSALFLTESNKFRYFGVVPFEYDYIISEASIEED